MTHKYGYIIIGALLLASCSNENAGPDNRPTPTTAPLEMYIAVPSSAAKSRAVVPGDPGEPTGESDDWDRLTVIVAYTSKATGSDVYDSNPDKMVYYDTFTKDEFSCLDSNGNLKTEGVEHASSQIKPLLNADGTDSGYRTYTMSLPLGTVHVYGVTYSAGDRLDLDSELGAIKNDGADHNADIQNLKISNDYAVSSNGTLNVSRFVSVATGYALNYKDAQNPTPNLVVAMDNTSEMHQYWSMTLHRLAAKIDVQWDAYDAYNNATKAYESVSVTSFAYNGGATTSGSGYGRLFPFAALHPASYEFTPLGGTKTFYNESAISKRNGRVYHYVFPDGSAQSTVTFNLKTKENNEAEVSRQYTYKFAQALQPANWYKVNTTIKGNSQAETTITIDRFNTSK